jgi:hypothetical protein
VPNDDQDPSVSLVVLVSLAVTSVAHAPRHPSSRAQFRRGCSAVTSIPEARAH